MIYYLIVTEYSSSKFSTVLESLKLITMSLFIILLNQLQDKPLHLFGGLSDS